MKKSVFYLLFILLLGSCIPNLNRDLQLEWQPEFLGPIAYAQLTPDDLTTSIEPEAQYQLDAANLGIPGYQAGIPINVPALGPLNLPASYESLSEMINTLEADEAVFTLSLQNNMPINIKQGTHIVAFDSATQDIIFDHIIDRDIMPGDSYSNSETAYQKVLTSSWGMQVRDFRSDGGSNVQFSGNPLAIRYKLKIVRFLRATLNPGKEFSFDLDTEINLPSSDSTGLSDIHGFLSLFFDNNLPAELELSLQLLNQQNDTLYRFFNGMPLIIPSAQLDAQGNTVASVPTDFPEIVSLDTLQTFMDVTRLTGKIRFRSPNINALPVVDIDNYFKIKLAAKLGFTMEITQ